MVIVGLLSWWYTIGWKQAAERTALRLAGILDYFSLGLLARSLFAPFRQISAGKVNGPLAVQLRAWVDQLISRVIGAVIRSMVLVIGAVTLLLSVTVSGVYLVLWALVPLLPVIGLTLMLTGWIPWHL